MAKRVRNGNWRDGMNRGARNSSRGNGGGKFCVARHRTQSAASADRQEKAIETKTRQDGKEMCREEE